ncbi:cytidylate kinase [Halorubrum sp. Ib24]|uniref:(d)CMP kinase n=1 Tax=unclassified Halorubrum TaxID=2642239 RepID=UPI000B988EE9|nr:MULTISPECIES: AAA family ATPase [unclassified Halorubrum]OYR38195.1 cytidylate kinase [Halorubrum sp. Ib24]OYR45605.1 cytidylate kinase [Halorubrum sp. Eb13]OYR55993.1 cytidylate kinase [Halorubrum sp. Ea1]
MLITVSGPPGSGKSTNAAGLAGRLGLEHVSGGDIFREMAADRDMTPVEFNEFAEEDPQFDRKLDRRLREIATTRDELVLESRLAGWLAADHADFRFWFDAPLSVRAERIADRESKPVDRARTETRRREDSERKRYGEFYGIDIDDLSIYDAAYNTARWSPDSFLDVLVATVEAYDPDDDEGKAPIEGVTYDF